MTGNGYALRGVPVRERIVLLSEVQPDGCWLWQSKRNRLGYGEIRLQGRSVIAHRASYESYVGPIPAGMQIDHLCRNTGCVNPAHLEPVTQLENMRRRYALQTECAYGHEFTETNTRIYKGRRRACRACDRRRQREYKARRAAS